jgi:hypothetical protein
VTKIFEDSFRTSGLFSCRISKNTTLIDSLAFRSHQSFFAIYTDAPSKPSGWGFSTSDTTVHFSAF